MRVRDAEDSIYRDLRALAWRPYLGAMWLLCNELRSLYADQFSEDDTPLIESTMDLVRRAVATGDPPDARRKAKKLVKAWDRLINRREDAAFGLKGTWTTFRALALEIADVDARYWGSDFVIGVAIERWREQPEPHSVVLVNPPDEQTDDASPMAQTLTRFAGIVRKVSEAQGPQWDPVSILNG